MRKSYYKHFLSRPEELLLDYSGGPAISLVKLRCKETAERRKGHGFPRDQAAQSDVGGPGTHVVPRGPPRERRTVARSVHQILKKAFDLVLWSKKSKSLQRQQRGSGR